MSAVDITTYIIGKARVGFRAVGVLTPYTIINTLEDTTVRVNADNEVFDPSLELDVGGPIAGFQYIPRVGGVELEFSVAQIDATNIGLLLPGSTSVTSATTAAGSPLSTTSSAIANVGDTSIPLVAVTNAAVGDWIKIDLTTLAEYRQITAINSLVVSFFAPLSLPHASGIAVTETIGDGRTTYSPPLAGRVSSTSLKEFRCDWQKPDAAPGSLIIFRGLAKLDSPYELTLGPRSMARARVTISGFRDAANIEAAPFALIQ